MATNGFEFMNIKKHNVDIYNRIVSIIIQEHGKYG